MSHPEHTHLDEDTLALVALGEGVDEPMTRHVATCAQCREGIDSFARVVMAGRALERSDLVLESPPAIVWERISAQLALERDAAGADGSGADVRVAADVGELGGHGGSDARVVRLEDHPRRRAAATPPGERRRSRTTWLVAAAAAGLLAGVAATVGWQAVTSDDPAVLVAAEMDPLPAKQGSGEADVTEKGDDRELNVTLSADVPDDAYLQVWLMSPDLQRMVPVGVLEGDSGFWRVPDGLDLGEFPVVDVSIEPLDGNAAHSGDSLVRGVFQGA